MQTARNLLRGPAGTAVAVVVLLGGGVAAYFALFGGGPTAGDLSNDRVFVDGENGKPFNAHLSVGDAVPVKSPFTGKMTGVEGTPCYWTADGTVKKTPDYVALKQLMGQRGPTFCPVCHRLVVAHNPVPTPGQTPPPTEAEYNAARGDGNAADTNDR